MALPIVSGLGLALATVWGLAMLDRMREQRLAAVLLFIVAVAWVLFALQSGSGVDIAFHVAVAFAFASLAAAGWVYAPRLLGAGFIAHGLFDVTVPLGPAPPWWPIFCLSYDVTLGVWLLRWEGSAET